MLNIGTFDAIANKEILLQEGERILGIKSKLHSEGMAWQSDLVFVVGRLLE